MKHIKQAPTHFIHMADGVLMGGDRGEWGGELVFRDSNGRDHRLLDENVLGIIAHDGGAFVFTGLAHLGINDGAIYDLSDAPPPGIPHPRLIHRLTGAP